MWNSTTIRHLANSNCVLPGHAMVLPLCHPLTTDQLAGLVPLVTAGVIRLQTKGTRTCVVPGVHQSAKLCSHGLMTDSFMGLRRSLHGFNIIRTEDKLKQICDNLTLLPNANRVGVCRAGGSGVGPTQHENCDRLSGTTWHDPNRDLLFKCSYHTQHGCMPMNIPSAGSLEIARACEHMPSFTGPRNDPSVSPAGWTHIKSEGRGSPLVKLPPTHAPVASPLVKLPPTHAPVASPLVKLPPTSPRGRRRRR